MITPTTHSPPARQSWVNRFVKDAAAMCGTCIVAAWLLIAALSPLIAPHDPATTDLRDRRAAPTLSHPLGKDEFGRDMLSRLVAGARITLGTGVISVLIGALLGTGIGLVAGYYGGWVDALAMRSMDFLLAFPYFLLAIVIVAVLGPGVINVMIAVGIASIPQYARVVRGSVLSVKQREFIEAAHAVGQGHALIILRHVLPMVIGPLIVLATLGMATAILSASALSFLGLGAQPPTIEWGLMLNAGKGFIASAPHMSVAPGVAIMSVAAGFNLVGDGLRDALDPKGRH